jgi:hypothetical protein
MVSALSTRRKPWSTGGAQRRGLGEGVVTWTPANPPDVGIPIPTSGGKYGSDLDSMVG